VKESRKLARKLFAEAKDGQEEDKKVVGRIVIRPPEGHRDDVSVVEGQSVALRPGERKTNRQREKCLLEGCNSCRLQRYLPRNKSKGSMAHRWRSSKMSACSCDMKKARTIFAKHGCIVDSEKNIVKFPRSVVEKYCRMMPPTFTFHGRDSKYDRIIPQDSPVIVTGSSAPNILDPVTGQERRARSDDIARIAHLVNELPGYDIFSVSVLADDAPDDQFTLARLYPALKYCLNRCAFPVKTWTMQRWFCGWAFDCGKRTKPIANVPSLHIIIVLSSRR